MHLIAKIPLYFLLLRSVFCCYPLSPTSPIYRGIPYKVCHPAEYRSKNFTAPPSCNKNIVVAPDGKNYTLEVLSHDLASDPNFQIICDWNVTGTQEKFNLWYQIMTISPLVLPRTDEDMCDHDWLVYEWRTDGINSTVLTFTFCGPHYYKELRMLHNIEQATFFFHSPAAKREDIADELKTFVYSITVSSCPVEFRGSNGRLEYFENGTVELICDQGYAPAQDFPRVFNCYNESFVEENYKKPLECEVAQFCESPKIEKALVSQESGLFGWFETGSTIKIQCTDDYILEGSNTLTCLHGIWIPPKHSAFPACLPNLCQEFEIPNGHPERSSNVENGESVKIICDLGYSLVGSEFVKCQDQKWETQNDAPKCIRARCKRFSDKSILEINPRKKDGYFENDVVRVSCKDSYSLKGGDQIRCDQNGLWMSYGTFPSCVLNGCPPLFVSNVVDLEPGELPDGWHKNGKTISISCKSGYFRLGSSTLSCRDRKWESDEDFPICVPSKCEKLEIPNAELVYGSDPDGGDQYANVTCQEDYELLGDPWLKCNQGKWVASNSTADFPFCEKKHGVFWFAMCMGVIVVCLAVLAACAIGICVAIARMVGAGSLLW